MSDDVHKTLADADDGSASMPVIVALTSDQWDTVRTEFRWSRRFTLAVLACVVLIAGGLVALSIGNRSILTDVRFTAERTSRTADTIERVTSPEAQAENDRRTQELLVVIDCNNRRAVRDAIQEVVDGLAEQGVVQPFTVTAVCEGEGGQGE